MIRSPLDIAGMPDLRRARVVVIADDDTDISRLLQLRLERRGFQVVTVEDGDAALEAIEEADADIAFLDVAMPNRSGLEVLAELRSRELDVGVIMMTAFSSDRPAIDALRAGADDFLRKPFETAEFELVLERTVRRVELSRYTVWLQGELDDKRRQLEGELARAAVVQADLLPTPPGSLGAFEIAGKCRPALDVGGDFYDWLVEGDRLTFLLADVMGKGMSAALLMATVRAAFRAGAAQGAPALAVRHAARALIPDLLRSARFVTFFLGEVDLVTGHLRYVDAGHGYGFITSADGVRRLEVCGSPLGVLEDEVYEEREADIEPGGALVLFSDGVVDVDAGRGEAPFLGRLHGLSARLSVERLTVMPPETGAQGDDMTAVVLHRFVDAP